LKAFAYALPLLLALEASLALVAFDVPGWLPPVVAIGSLLVYAAVVTAFRGALLRWYFPSRPISQTEWAGLESRAREWGARLGVRVRAVYVRVRAVYVREMARFGAGGALGADNAAVYGGLLGLGDDELARLAADGVI